MPFVGSVSCLHPAEFREVFTYEPYAEVNAWRTVSSIMSCSISTLCKHAKQATTPRHRRHTREQVCLFLEFSPLILICAALLCFGSACRPDQDGATDGDQPGAVRKPTDLLVFPSELYAEDASVNAFVIRAMTDCASGDYEKFRLLWSAREEPLPRNEYEQGWQAVQKITIRALEKVILAEDPARGRDESETVYVILADVSLDPTHRAGQREPHREVAMMLVRETDEWRLSRAPKRMRAWIKERVRSGNAVTVEPADQPENAAKPD